jgi:hypothetical protein
VDSTASLVAVSIAISVTPVGSRTPAVQPITRHIPTDIHISVA